MSRYIDADKAKKHFGDYFEKIGVARRYAESIIDNAIPTADVVEVVHAYDKNIYPSLFECSNCGWSCNDTYSGEPCNRNDNTYDYCPNCGARIEYKVKEQEHE